MTYLFKLARRISGLRSVLVLGLMVGSACSKGDKIDYIGPNPNPITPAVTTLRVEPQIIAVQTGQQIQFTATALTATGESVPVTVDWVATGGSILTDGRFLADATGDFRVTARVRGHDTIADSARVSVWQNVTQIVNVLVSPDSTVMEEGDTLQADAVLKLADGTMAPGAVVTWTANGGTINDQGTFTAQTAGSYSLTAETVNGLQASAAVMVRSRQRTASSIEVSPSVSDVVPGQSIAFIANASYTDGSTGTEDVVWSATGGGVSPGGVFTAGNVAGQYVVVARQRKGTLADTASINISTPTVVEISINPSSIVLAPGATQQYGALALLTDNTWRPWPVTWKATSGTINTQGVYTAGNAFGTFKVIATATGASVADTVAVTISQPLATLTTLHLNPSSVSMPVGGTRQFSVTADWSDGTHAVPTVTWSATGGSIGSNGLYTAAGSTGTYSVTATSAGGVKATSTVTVTPPTLASMNLSPVTTSLLVGQTAQFSVTGVLSDGSATVPSVTWTVAGGTMSGTGLYTAGASAGTFAIIATQQSGTLADTAFVTVTVPAPVLNALVLSPGVMTLAPAAWVDFTVIGTWSDGSSSTPAVTWNATGGTMSGKRYTAGSVAGTYKVIAQEVGGTHADTTTVTITAPVTLTGLAISPKPASLNTGNALQYVATALWSNGTTTVPSLTWTANGGTVSGSGLYTAGTTPGTYWVHAKQTTGTIADSSSVTVSTGTSTAPSLLGISISPKPSSVAPGAPQQFTPSAIWSDGSTTLPPLTWTATGGTVTGAGLYVAGTTAGTFRVISAGGGKADTAAVTITTAAAPTLTGIVMTPGSATLLTGATQQFTAAG
ncbi:MAG TPA: Ig-like domain-containing protein, partial [Gemmatimonadales bacterium]|nr:Ig-like domain-containing protein [Gemmatimonadales bacterium]